jgi:hypothetical protein
VTPTDSTAPAATFATRGICEMGLEARDRLRPEDLHRSAFGWPVLSRQGDREDPEGNVVEVWDFFERGAGAREGAL